MPIRKSPGRPGRNDPPAPSRRRGIRIPAEVDEQLVKAAADRGISVHAAVREAVLLWLVAQGEQHHSE